MITIGERKGVAAYFWTSHSSLVEVSNAKEAFFQSLYEEQGKFTAQSIGTKGCFTANKVSSQSPNKVYVADHHPFFPLMLLAFTHRTAATP